MNPLAGVAATMGQLAKVVRTPKAPVAPVRPTPSRAVRRARGQRSKAQPRAAALTAARRAGELAGRQGKDHTVPGTCPYQVKQLVDAWAEGYVTGKRKREGTP